MLLYFRILIRKCRDKIQGRNNNMLDRQKYLDIGKAPLTLSRQWVAKKEPQEATPK